MKKYAIAAFIVGALAKSLWIAIPCMLFAGGYAAVKVLELGARA